jgi:hypothetical protein
VHTTHRLGKAPATYDRRDLQFAHYRAGALPPHPKTFGHEKLIGARAWQMLGNGPDDSVRPGFQGAGDCVFAGAAHETMMWNLEAGVDVKFTGANVIADYSAVTGYVVGDDSTDQGTDVRQALKYRQKTGIVDAAGKRHKIGAYLALEPGNPEQLYEALYLFGAVGIGIEFPESAMDQFSRGKPWSVVSRAPTDGGHYIPLVAKRTNLDCVTWGQLQALTLSFYDKYCDEAFAILSPEMLKGGKSLEGFDLAQLQADLAALKK